MDAGGACVLIQETAYRSLARSLEQRVKGRKRDADTCGSKGRMAVREEEEVRMRMRRERERGRQGSRAERKPFY